MRRLLSILILSAASILPLKSALACKCLAASPEQNIRIPDVIADVEVLEVTQSRSGSEEIAIAQVVKGWKGVRDGERLRVRDPVPRTSCSNGPLPKKGANVRMALALKKSDAPSITSYVRVYCYFFNPPEREFTPKQLEEIRQDEKSRKLGATDFLDKDPTDNAGRPIETLEAYRSVWSRLEDVTKKKPNSFQSQLNLAKFLIAWHDYRNALAPLKKAIALNPANHEARIYLRELRAKLDKVAR